MKMTQMRTGLVAILFFIIIVGLIIPISCQPADKTFGGGEPPTDGQPISVAKELLPAYTGTGTVTPTPKLPSASGPTTPQTNTGQPTAIGGQTSSGQTDQNSGDSIAIEKCTGLYDEKKYEEAYRCFDKVYYEEPQNKARILAWEGRCWEMLGDYENAKKFYEASHSYNKNDARTVEDLGLLEARNGHLDRALNAFKMEVEIDPIRKTGWLLLGGAFMNLGKNSDALKAFDKAIDVDQEYGSGGYYGRAWYYKGVVLGKLGRTTEANDAYKKAKEYGYNK